MFRIVSASIAMLATAALFAGPALANDLSTTVRAQAGQMPVALRDAAHQVCTRALATDWNGEFTSLQDCVNDSLSAAAPTTTPMVEVFAAADE